MNKSYLTVDIGGTKTALAIGFDDGQIIDRTEFATENPAETLEKTIKIGQALISKHSPIAIGISCGGPLDSRAGLILGPPNLPNWNRVPVVEKLQKALNIQTFLENDANAGALAEWTYGAGRGYKTVIFLTCGTGLGSGLILDGRLFRGKQDMAGEIGHIRMESDGPIGYFKAGSLEGFASGSGLTQLARKELQTPHLASLLDQYDPTTITAKEVGQTALSGDQLAQELVHTTGKYLGRGLAILIDILNPECIVLGSMAIRLGDLLLEPVRQEVQKESLEQAWKNCRIIPAQMADRIGDIAALCVARYNMQNMPY